jgi:hypothetical protein
MVVEDTEVVVVVVQVRPTARRVGGWWWGLTGRRVSQGPDLGLRGTAAHSPAVRLEEISPSGVTLHHADRVVVVIGKDGGGTWGSARRVTVFCTKQIYRHSRSRPCLSPMLVINAQE